MGRDSLAWSTPFLQCTTHGCARFPGGAGRRDFRERCPRSFTTSLGGDSLDIAGVYDAPQPLVWYQARVDLPSRNDRPSRGR